MPTIKEEAKAFLYKLRSEAFAIFSESRYFTNDEKRQYETELKKQYKPTGRTMFDKE